MTTTIETLQPGQIARIRQRTYLVEQIVKPKRVADSTLVKLSCVDDDNQGAPLEVLWEKELDPQVLTSEAWETIAAKGFDESKLFAAYLNTLKWNCVTSTDPKLFQSPFRAGIRLDAYQLEPLRKALLLPRVNLFIADDVGLGKTIEAGLIARELLLRKKVREIFVSCPPSMLLQWKEELESRFGLTFEILDKEYMKRVRRERGFSVNPWSTHTRFLISHRLLIDEAYAGPLRDHLGTFRSGSLFILDEAHHAAPSSGQKYAIDSQITRSVRDLAPRFEHRLFLSATPHNGHSNSFSALLEILDPQRFCRGVPVSAKHRDETIVRRIKEDIREIQGGFPKRRVVQVTIDGLSEDAPELKLSRLLNEYRQTREERLSSETKRKQAASGLLITGLQQRLLSSIEAFAKTLKVHRKTVKRQWEKQYKPDAQASDTGQLELAAEPPQSYRVKSLAGASGLYRADLLSGSVDSDDERASLTEEEMASEVASQVEAVSASTMGPTDDASSKGLFAREQQLLEEMTDVAEQARGKTDARTEKLIEWIRDNMCPDLGKKDAQWNDTRVLIFTEYDDTKRYLVSRLEAAIAGSDRADARINIFHGPTPPPKREEIKQAFNTDPKKHPVRILIATDAAREGLNLQAHCSNLFHFDVPWNPSRMEQRNGRIDRKLQAKDEVFCHYFVYKQRPEDRILQVLVRKTETIRKELGSLSQVIDAKLTKSMSLGIRHGSIDDMEAEIDSTDIEDNRRAAIEDELEASRMRQTELREQIDRLRTLLEKSRKSIGLSDEHFQSAISCSLALLGTETLTQYQPEAQASESKTEAQARGQGAESLAGASGLYVPGNVTAYQFPAIDERSGADPTWAETMDTLRVPRKRDQKLWEWRRSSPIRPVIFEDPGVVGDDLVHLHLEQRVVQRLLGRFTAQGFVHHDLSRACFAQATDSIPRVVLLGRLALYGEGAARLHEELIPVTARWSDPAIRRGPLSPYAKDAEAKTMGLLDDSLLGAGGIKLTPEVVEQLQQSAAGDIHELLPHLETRGEEYAADAERKLAARGTAEAKAMREILETQRKHISDTIKRISKLDPNQMRFDFGEIDDELLQLDANKRYWAKRLEELRDELKTEPDRIASIYDVQAKRIEPVGLVYLWPVTG
ncbi:RNA polymerase-associated protein RapA [Rubripirellula obstinata]|uniref:RNA polymerase-associated protein RapA n=1 Tax=Rubripirellula obstinata TaxID=406547 RepID=A0A5B1CF30_9BACT|nr:DISARM system SNF2-like helicase DrmD [Rubripirellula obstinata]KAA1258073.1 RNA polymerase-associated protein RapA [Rubripirellula obstinata]